MYFLCFSQRCFDCTFFWIFGKTPSKGGKFEEAEVEKSLLRSETVAYHWSNVFSFALISVISYSFIVCFFATANPVHVLTNQY